jgi:hypothetical protein
MGNLMQLILCSTRDRAAEAYSRPMYVQSIGLAIRAFTDEINRNDPNNQLFNHPDDFDLYELGTFDDSTAKFEIKDTPELLILGKNAKTT